MVSGQFENNKLKLYMERIDRLEDEKKGIGDDIRDVYGEAKADGFKPSTMRKCRALMKQPKELRDEEESLLEAYKEALGIKTFETTPLGSAGANTNEEGGTGVTEPPAKAKRGRPKTVRDPSDGSKSLVTVGDDGDSVVKDAD